MRFAITGLNHRTAPLEVRERLAFREESLAEALHSLKSEPGLLEGMILSTCNRVEVAVTSEDNCDPVSLATGFLERSHGLEPGWASPYLYHHEDRDAVRHLFRVASILDSRAADPGAGQGGLRLCR